MLGVDGADVVVDGAELAASDFVEDELSDDDDVDVELLDSPLFFGVDE